MRPASSLLLPLLLGSLACPLEAGAIRPTAQMGPQARRILASMRQERTEREKSKEAQRLARRVAVIRVKTSGEDPDLATRVAREFEEELVKRGFSVRPYREVWPRIEGKAEDLLASPHTLRQLCRRLAVGRAIQLTVHELRLTTGRDAGFASPSWWGPAELDQEFAEAHLRLQIFDATEGKVVIDRQDRQHQLVPPPRDGAPSARGAILGEVLGKTTDHLLFDLVAPGKS